MTSVNNNSKASDFSISGLSKPMHNANANGLFARNVLGSTVLLKSDIGRGKTNSNKSSSWLTNVR
jgi:hypothetical protein